MDTFTFDFTFEPEIDGFCVGTFDCRAHVEVTELESDDWHISQIELCGSKQIRPTAGDLRSRRIERHFTVAESHTYFAEMKAVAERIAPAAIDGAYNRGEIGPAAAAAARADYMNDLAKEAAE